MDGKTASRHTSPEFVAFLEDLVAQQPDPRPVKWRYAESQPSDRRLTFNCYGPLRDRVQAFDGTYISVSAAPLVFARKGRADLSLMARKVGGQPEVHVWNVNGAVLLKKLDVLSKDVE